MMITQYTITIKHTIKMVNLVKRYPFYSSCFIHISSGYTDNSASTFTIIHSVGMYGVEAWLVVMLGGKLRLSTTAYKGGREITWVVVVVIQGWWILYKGGSGEWLCITRTPPLCFAARTAAPPASLLNLRAATQHTTFHISASHVERNNEQKEEKIAH